MIVAEESYETSEPTIDSHIVKLKAAGADVFMNFSTPKFAAQAIKKIAEIGWKPTHIVSGVSSSVGTVMKPAGFDAAQGIISANYLKDVSDPKWKEDPGMTQFLKFMARYFPEGDTLDNMTVAGYGIAQTMVRVLELCGDDLTRENVMKQASETFGQRCYCLESGSIPDLTTLFRSAHCNSWRSRVSVGSCLARCLTARLIDRCVRSLGACSRSELCVHILCRPILGGLHHQYGRI
jgi:hypothetical protein